MFTKNKNRNTWKLYKTNQITFKTKSKRVKRTVKQPKSNKAKI